MLQCPLLAARDYSFIILSAASRAVGFTHSLTHSLLKWANTMSIFKMGSLHQIDNLKTCFCNFQGTNYLPALSSWWGYVFDSLGFWLSGVSIWWRRKVSKLVVVCNLTIIDKGPFIAWGCLKSSSTTCPRCCGWQPQVNSQNSRSTPFCFWNLVLNRLYPSYDQTSTSQLMLKTCTLDPHPPTLKP